jgi:NAD-dependent deacetylase
MQRIVVFTGAGISAESGLKTFRDAGGLWENHRVEEVASPEAWQENPELVLQFYNERRRQAQAAQPNAAHLALAQLERRFDVQIITQNVDDLHERAGSTNILHLHGELGKARSTLDGRLVYNVAAVTKNGVDIVLGDQCELGSQLRPHIVWFGEIVPDIRRASRLCEKADFFVVIGTSMLVHPAASLIHYVPQAAAKVLIDPDIPVVNVPNLYSIREKATIGVVRMVEQLLK